jgi:hypothetical protein
MSSGGGIGGGEAGPGGGDAGASSEIESGTPNPVAGTHPKHRKPTQAEKQAKRYGKKAAAKEKK